MPTENRVLLALRTKAGMSRREVAQRLDITETYYWMIETGRRTPGLGLGMRMARLFDVSLEQLFCAHQRNAVLADEALKDAAREVSL